MSLNRKLLVFCGIVLILIGALDIVQGACTLAGVFEPESEIVAAATASGMSESLAVSVFYTVVVVVGVIGALVGALGILGGFKPKYAGAFFVLGMIASVISVIGLVCALATGSFSFTDLQILVVWCYTFIAWQVKREQ